MATQNASNVTITGGTVNNVAIGGSTASTGAFTTLTASGIVTFSSNLNANGGFDVSDVLVIDTAGDLTTSGSATFSGAVALNGATTISQDITFSATTPSIAVTNGATFSLTDGTNNLLQIADSGSNGSLTVNAATISGLSSGVVYNTSGALSSEAQLSVARGGTGLASITSGSLLYGNGTGATSLLSISGSSGKCLTSTGSAPQWQDCNAVSGVGDISAVNTGNGLSGGATSGDVTVDINTAYDFIWSGATTFSKTGATAVAITGAPTNVSTSSLIQVGSAIASGNSVANGGTYIGMNVPTSGAGSAADFINLQYGGVSQFKLTSDGNLTVAGTINTASITGGNISGGSINGADISGGTLSSSAVNGLSVASGVVSGSGQWQAATIAAIYGGTGMTSYTAGDLLYASDSTHLTTLGAGTEGNCLVQGASSTPTWASCAGSGAGGVTLQAAYGNGNTITTTDSRNISFTVANTATDANILFNMASGVTSDSSTGRFAIQNAGTDTFQVLKTGATTISSTLAVTGNTTLTGDLAINGGDVTSTATTFNLAIGNTGTYNLTDGTNTLLSVADSGSNGTLTVGGTNVVLGKTGSLSMLSLAGSLAGANYTLAQASSSVYLNAQTGGAINFSVNDSAKAILDTNGNFGVGTSGTTMGAKLQVINSSGAQARLSYSGNTTYNDLTTDVSGNLNVTSATSGANLIVTTTAGGLTFSGSGTHTLSASSGTLSVGAHTLAGAITGANQNITGIGNITATSTSNTISGFGTINGATLSGGTLSGGTVSGGTLSGGTYSATSATGSAAYSVIAQGGNVNLQASTGLIAINQSGVNNELRLYGSGGVKYASLTNNNTNTVLSSSTGELQLVGGDGTSQFILGDSSASVNLIFERSSTIANNTVGGIITVGDSDDVFNMNTAASYYFGTLKSSAGSALTLSPGATSGTAVAVNPTSFSSGNLLDLQVNSVSKFSVNQAGSVTGTAATFSSLVNATTDGLATKVVAGAVTDGSFTATAQNGQMAIDSSNGRIYFRYSGAWHYVSQTAGFQIPNYETNGISIGDPVVGMIDGATPDGALHGVFRPLSEAQPIQDMQSEIDALQQSIINPDLGNTAINGTLTVSGTGTHTIAGTLKVAQITSATDLTIAPEVDKNIVMSPTGTGIIRFGSEQNNITIDANGKLVRNGTATTNQASEHFQDLESASTNAVLAATICTGTSVDITTGINNPDVPRVVAITESGVGSASGNVTVTGTLADGSENATETIALHNNATSIGQKAFATISKITVPSTCGASSTIVMGVGDKVGLSNGLHGQNGVYKLRKNAADIVPLPAVDTTNSTIDLGTITQGDDVTVWYRY
jgi:hypothetical protein